MTYADIEKVNSTLNGIDVKGKEYIQVNDRITAFRKLFPEGTIKTEIISLADGMVVMKAEAYNDGKLLGVGHAYEKETSSFINKTSYIENCETSAVGRALGMLGIGIATSVASYEEVGNAMAQQDQKGATKEKKTITEMEAITLGQLLQKAGVNIEKLCEMNKVSALKDLTPGQYSKIMGQLKAKTEKKDAE